MQIRSLLAALLAAISTPATAQVSTLRAATLLGGIAPDEIRAMAVGPDGTVYVAGTTESANFPATPGAFDTALGGEADAFVARFSADLTTLLAATYVGGTTGTNAIFTRDEGRALAVRGDAVFLAGYTATTDFPTTTGGVQPAAMGDGDGFVVRLSADLSTVVAGTYLGADEADVVTAIALDPQGDIVVTGHHDGSGFPYSAGAHFASTTADGGPFVTRLSADLSVLGASTGFNNTHTDPYHTAVAVHPTTGDIYIGGTTSDRDFQTTAGAFDRTCGTDGICNFVNPFNGPKSDGFVLRFDRDLTTLLGSTFLGGQRYDAVTALTWSPGGDLVVGGSTDSNAFPTTAGVFQQVRANTGNNIAAAFVTRFDATLSAVTRSTFLGGAVDGSGIRALVAQPGSGEIVAVGQTRANDFPVTPGAPDGGFQGFTEPFLTVFSSDLTAVPFSTYLGGTDTGSSGSQVSLGANAVALGSDGGVYLAGAAREPNFPATPGAYQTTAGGAADGFVAHLAGFLVASGSGPGAPLVAALHAPSPNPVRGTVALGFTLPDAVAVRLVVLDALGREVAVLVDGVQPAGHGQARLDARGLPSGTYLVRLTAGGAVETRAVSVVR